ncbi:MAG TPA: CRISPR-associated protein, partial [Lachnospiraceae bacterium]|nr:CRISPR-associated protein [Lachnospiraceae bacterium]
MFINYSNHPSGSWADSQKRAALAEYDSITDVPFPVVPVTFTSEAVGQLAETEVRKLFKMLQESE